MNYAYREVLADTTATANDKVIGVDTANSGGTVFITLPLAGSVRSGFALVIKDTGGNATSNTIVVSGGDEIDGQGLVSMNIPYASITLMSISASAGHTWSIL